MTMREHDDSAIGEYYERHQREATALARRIREARERGAPAEVIRQLEAELERARYVGD